METSKLVITLTSATIFPEDFKENSPRLVVVALIVMKLYILKVGAVLKHDMNIEALPSSIDRKLQTNKLILAPELGSGNKYNEIKFIS